jgi:hypothetical protein
MAWKMSPRIFRILACLAILITGALLITGCASPQEEVTTKHFEADGFSFDYPGTWSALESYDPDLIAYLGEAGTDTAVKVYAGAMPSFITLKTYYDELVLSLMVGQPISGRSLAVAGATGYETVFRTKVGTQDIQMRLVSFEKEGMVCDIYFSAAPASFDQVRGDFDVVVNSLSVQ